MTGIDPVYLAAEGCITYHCAPWTDLWGGGWRMNRAALLFAAVALTDCQNSRVDALRIVKVNHT